MSEHFTPAVVSEQPLDEKERALVARVYDHFRLFEQNCRPYHEKAREAREILRLNDPKQDPPDTPDKEKTLQLQTLKSTFNNSVAEQVMNMPQAKLLPETPDKETVAADLQDVVRYCLDSVNDYEAIHRRRVEDVYAVGTAITQVVWDENLNHGKGDVALIRWALEAFLWDTAAEDIQDCRAVIKVSWHPMSWYWEHYPDKAMYVSGDQSERAEVGMPDVQRSIDSSDEPRAALLEYWYRVYDAKKKRWTINVAYCAGGALLEDFKDVYMHGMYPFVVDVHTTVEGSLAGDGMVMELAPMMRYINRYAKYVDTNLRFSSKGRLLVRKNNGIDRKVLANWDNDLIEGDSVVAGEDWNWLQHSPLPSTATQMMLQMQSDLKMDSGMNQYSRGESTGGVVSGKAIMALQSAGGKVSTLRQYALNCGFRKIVEMVIWEMAQFYDEERVIYITGRDANKEIEFKPENFFGKKGNGAVSAPPYMVQVEVEQRSPDRIDAMNQMYMQAYTMAAQAQQYFPLSALFRLMNIEGKDRLLPVIEENEQQQQVMQQLQQQNQQLQEQMQQLMKQNDSLKRTSTQMSNALASIGAQQNGGYMPQQGNVQKVAEEDGGGNNVAGFLKNSRPQIDAAGMD